MKPFLLPSLETGRIAKRAASLLLKLLIFLPLPALCQVQRVTSANIPFAFSVSGSTMPAGNYLLYHAHENVYVLQSTDGSVKQNILVYPDSLNTPVHAGKLVFRTYGNGYYLASFWKSGSCDGFRLQKSKAERTEIAALRKPTGAEVMIASSGTVPPKL